MKFRDDDKIKQLVLRYMKGELSETEEKELDQWRGECAGHEELFRRVTAVKNLETGIRRFVKTKSEEEKMWRQIRSRTIGKGQVRKIRWTRYAAVLTFPFVLIAMLFFLLKQDENTPGVAQIIPGQTKAILIKEDGHEVLLTRHPDEKQHMLLSGGILNDGDTLNYTRQTEVLSKDVAENYHTLRVPRGGEYTLVLADGTVAYLNAESELKFPVQFKGKNRKVYLRGEAYFDVKHDEESPFMVETYGVVVKVLGTSFGVRAYEEEKNILTTLVRGSVNVSADGKVVKLLPGEQADFNKVNESLTALKVDVERYVGWKDGRLIFDDQPLGEILHELGRWYSFDADFPDAALKQIPYSLNIKKHENIAEVLRLIERTGKVKFEINNHIITVK